MADDAEDREDEIMVLQSIYNEIVEIEEGVEYEMGIQVELPWDTWNLELPSVERNADAEEAPPTSPSYGGDSAGVLELAHVPPLVLRWKLPPKYPSEQAPRFQMRAAWLNRVELAQLAAHLDELARAAEGSVVIHEWVDFLRNDLFTHLDLARDHTLVPCDANVDAASVDARALQVPSRAADARAYLRDYARREAARRWECSVHECAICMTAKTGRDSHRFGACGHVFCKDCMREHFSVQIRGGNVRGLTCPAHKCTTQAHPHEVKGLVSADAYERWERVLFSRTLDELGGIVYCPSCQSPVWRDEDTSTPNLAVCAHCTFTFCAKCKRTYHGVVPCVAMADVQTMLEAYKAASPRSRKNLEQHFSVDFFNEVRNELWLRKHTKPCPFCSAPIEKSGGCNHITCANCSRESCWLCGGPYDYTHFYVTDCVQFDEFDTREWEDVTRELLD